MVNRFRLAILIIVSFLLAGWLMLFPVPYDWQWVAPRWLALALIYWILAFPKFVGILTGWFVGFGFDILKGGLLGQHALSLLMVAYLTGLLRHRSRLSPVWYQGLLVGVLVGLGDWVLLITQWLIGHPPRTLSYWMPTVSSALLWPFVYRFLKLCERKTLG